MEKVEEFFFISLYVVSTFNLKKKNGIIVVDNAYSKNVKKIKSKGVK